MRGPTNNLQKPSGARALPVRPFPLRPRASPEMRETNIGIIAEAKDKEPAGYFVSPKASSVHFQALGLAPGSLRTPLWPASARAELAIRPPDRYPKRLPQGYLAAGRDTAVAAASGSAPSNRSFKLRAVAAPPSP